MEALVYNLQFPSWCQSLTVSGYSFVRVDDYSTRVSRLQHLVGSHAEFSITPTTGQHCPTAIVEHPDPEHPPILQWSGETATALSDVLLILSLFTGRDVFISTNGLAEESGVILRDPRTFPWGGILRMSIPYKGQEIDPAPYRFNIGFEEGLNRVYTLLQDQAWQEMYAGGYFLFLANQAFRRQTLEAAFVQCWTIWEHLFAAQNQACSRIKVFAE